MSGRAGCARLLHSRGRKPAVCTAISLLVACCLFSACKSGPQGEPAPTGPPGAATIAYLELAEAHNARVDKLQTSYSDGVIEFRWRDADGKEHFEPQVDLDLWIELPRRTALRADKLGEEVLWLGSDETRYWLFDLLGEERILNLGRHDRPLGDTQTGALDIRPLALLDLLGLSRLPVSEPHPEVRGRPGESSVVIETTGGGGSPIRMTFDSATRLPTRVAVLDAGGEIVLGSTLRQYESAAKRGVAVMALPKMPRLIEIAAPARPDSGRPSGEVKIAFEHTTADVDAEELARVFDLERLRAGLRPERIVDHRQP